MKKVEELTAKILEANPELDRYTLAIAVSARGDELTNGAPTKLNVDVKSVKPADLALMEISEGLVKVAGFEKKEK